eukprot:1159054-Pelagomonas_calceolata.AAC.12
MASCQLIIKNPQKAEGFPLDISLDATIADLQARLAESYPGKPPPSEQTLIYAGRVLKDKAVTLREIVGKSEPVSGPHNFHLVCKPPPTPPPAAQGPLQQSASASTAVPPPPSTSSAGPSHQDGTSNSSVPRPQRLEPIHAPVSQPVPTQQVPLSIDDEDFFVSLIEGLEAFMPGSARPPQPQQQETEQQQHRQQQQHQQQQQQQQHSSGV